MLISEIGIRGYKSFGNNEQVVKLNTNNGELVLLVGKNGNGKSSLLESFEYTLYGKVKSGKTKKWHKLSTLPNRINGELLNRIKYKTMDNFNKLINSEKPLLVDFFAEWCGPCKTMAPILKEVKTQLGDKSTIIKIDIDKNPEVAKTYQVRSVPTLILFKNGKSVWKQSGVIQANELVKIINQFQ